jgi:hypothetical protein
MKVIYIDVETTGLDWTRHQMLQLAMVADDLANPKPWEELPKLNIRLSHNPIIGDPVAIAMNHQKILSIANGENDAGIDCTDPQSRSALCSLIIYWLRENSGYGTKKGNYYQFNAVGKNAAGFDFNFLWEAAKGGLVQGSEPHATRNGVSISFASPRSSDCYTLASRVLDPGSIMTDLVNDERVPSLNECLKRLGIEENTVHDAMDDCYLLHRIMRRLAELQKEQANLNE